MHLFVTLAPFPQHLMTDVMRRTRVGLDHVISIKEFVAFSEHDLIEDLDPVADGIIIAHHARGAKDISALRTMVRTHREYLSSVTFLIPRYSDLDTCALAKKWYKLFSEVKDSILEFSDMIGDVDHCDQLLQELLKTFRDLHVAGKDGADLTPYFLYIDIDDWLIAALKNTLEQNVARFGHDEKSTAHQLIYAYEDTKKIEWPLQLSSIGTLSNPVDQSERVARIIYDTISVDDALYAGPLIDEAKTAYRRLIISSRKERKLKDSLDGSLALLTMADEVMIINGDGDYESIVLPGSIDIKRFKNRLPKRELSIDIPYNLGDQQPIPGAMMPGLHIVLGPVFGLKSTILAKLHDFIIAGGYPVEQIRSLRMVGPYGEPPQIEGYTIQDEEVVDFPTVFTDALCDPRATLVFLDSLSGLATIGTKLGERGVSSQLEFTISALNAAAFNAGLTIFATFRIPWMRPDQSWTLEDARANNSFYRIMMANAASVTSTFLVGDYFETHFEPRIQRRRRRMLFETKFEDVHKEDESSQAPVGDEDMGAPPSEILRFDGLENNFDTTRIMTDAGE